MTSINPAACGNLDRPVVIVARGDMGAAFLLEAVGVTVQPDRREPPSLLARDRVWSGAERERVRCDRPTEGGAGPRNAWHPPAEGLG
jgi:hypothetical protein